MDRPSSSIRAHSKRLNLVQNKHPLGSEEHYLDPFLHLHGTFYNQQIVLYNWPFILLLTYTVNPASSNNRRLCRTRSSIELLAVRVSEIALQARHVPETFGTELSAVLLPLSASLQQIYLMSQNIWLYAHS
jgi:hypothetical protein